MDGCDPFVVVLSFPLDFVLCISFLTFFCVCACVCARVFLQVVAQGERSLSLSLGSKGLHLTLADRPTKEFLWEHLRKMREQAREQAKASRITRAASIDAISDAQDIKRCVRLCCVHTRVLSKPWWCSRVRSY